MKKTLYYFQPSNVAGVLKRFASHYDLVALERGGKLAAPWQWPAVFIADLSKGDLRRVEDSAPAHGLWRTVCLVGATELGLPRQSVNGRLFAALPRSAPPKLVEMAVERAFETLESARRHEETRRQLHLAASELVTLNRIGVALSNERNTESLLELILTKSREITTADAGSLFLVEEADEGAKHLVFTLTQCDSQAVPFRQFTLPIDTHSIAGYAAATGEVVNIRDAYRIRKLPFRHNRDFDRKFGYRTKSMMVVPMKNQKDEVIGVLQLINAKRQAGTKLTKPREVVKHVVPFSRRSQELASSLASQAAVALENNLLYRDIHRLFEGFVKASVTAIESRDPTTFGHSERVAKLTVGLAEAVDRDESGLYREIHFTRQEIQELRYASLLHDFGKVGVREEVLIKAKKLYPSQIELIKKRFLYIRKAVELERLRKKLDYVVRNGNQNYQGEFAGIDTELEAELRKLDEFLQQIMQANEPSVLPEKASEKLAEIAGWTFQDPSGHSEALVSPEEVRLLSIPKGSLDADERLQIESHVIHSYRFLSQIPWTKELRRIPEIAKAHHEKLNGTGYPYHMTAEEIPFQAKMMTISDIFDALTARDRPYKKAVPVDRALSIIGEEVKSQLLDPNLFHLFVAAQVFQLSAKD
ncbi:MAG: HD family phosphohydrolase [Acidobacteria bacterium]|nr:MAG: HD family phosphohydrolase [Acidobacteriota bacterium]